MHCYNFQNLKYHVAGKFLKLMMSQRGHHFICLNLNLLSSISDGSILVPNKVTIIQIQNAFQPGSLGFTNLTFFTLDNINVNANEVLKYKERAGTFSLHGEKRNTKRKRENIYVLFLS